MLRRLTVLVSVLFCLLVPAYASADYNPLGNACDATNGAAAQSAACSADPNKDPLTGPGGVLQKVTLVLGVLAGIVAVIIIIIGGIQYILASGDAQKAAAARQSIIGAVVGLVIIALSTTIIIFVVSKL